MICISSHSVYSSYHCSIHTVTFIDTVLILHFPAVAPLCVYVSPGMCASLLCGHVPLIVLLCCLPTPMTLASLGESDVPACGPPASFSVHLASSAVTPAGSVHKSRGDNVVRMWVQLKR